MELTDSSRCEHRLWGWWKAKRFNPGCICCDHMKDSLTPSHDAKEAKDGWLEVSQIQPGAPLDVVVEAPHNHPKELND